MWRSTGGRRTNTHPHARKHTYTCTHTLVRHTEQSLAYMSWCVSVCACLSLFACVFCRPCLETKKLFINRLTGPSYFVTASIKKQTHEEATIEFNESSMKTISGSLNWQCIAAQWIEGTYDKIAVRWIWGGFITAAPQLSCSSAGVCVCVCVLPFM